MLSGEGFNCQLAGDTPHDSRSPASALGYAVLAGAVFKQYVFGPPFGL
jgi:hypothetical protein